MSFFFHNIFRNKKEEAPQETISDISSFKIIAPVRPHEVLSSIGAMYTRRRQSPVPFGFSKNSDYYFSFLAISGYDFIVKFCATSKKEHVSVLHIGIGDTTFAQRLKETLGDTVRVTILSPADPREGSQKEEGINIPYIVGNVEYASTLFSADTFDIIISTHISRDFVDPLGTIEQLYQALKPQGILLIDDFYLPGIHNQLPNLFTFLNQQNYAIVADYIYSIEQRSKVIQGLRCIFIKKTFPQLTIPDITYQENTRGVLIDTSVSYVLSSFPSVEKHISSETNAFIDLVHRLIPDLSEDGIIQAIFNPHILNNPLNSLEKDAYAQALQASFKHLLQVHHISVSAHMAQEAFAMIPFIGSWIEQLHNKKTFFKDIQDHIGIEVRGRSLVLS